MEITRARYSYNKGRERKGRIKKFMLIFAASLLAVSSGGYAAAAFSKELPELSVSSTTAPSWTPEVVTLPWPGTGQAAIGSLEDGVLARSSASELPKPIASMTKIVTALTVMKKSPHSISEQGPTYSLTAEDVSIYNMYVAKNGSVVPVRAGQTITQYQAMQALLLASANNMADALAEWNFGSMENYIVEANNLVGSYGLQNTTISDASGFSPQTVSTPSDMIILAQRALQDPVIASIVSQSQADIPGIGVIRNTNRLLVDKNVIGLKTGTTDEAGSCLLFAAKHAIDETHSVTVIGVVMGGVTGTSVFRDSRALLDAAYTHFAEVTVVPAGTVVGSVTSPWGQQTDLVTKQDLKVFGWKGKDLQTKTTLSQVSVPLDTNQKLGSVEITNTESAPVEVAAKQAITKPSNVWRLQNVF